MTSPFLPAPPEEAPVEVMFADPVVGDGLHRSGLSSPRRARDVTGEVPAEPAPKVTADTVWLVGASGGVGVSTLAMVAGGQVIDGGVHSPPWQAPAFVVAATHTAGLQAAAALARANARGEVSYEVLGLVLVYDRPQLSKAGIQLAKEVSGVYPVTMTVPFIEAWRDQQVPDPSAMGVRARRTVRALSAGSRRKK